MVEGEAYRWHVALQSSEWFVLGSLKHAPMPTVTFGKQGDMPIAFLNVILVNA